MKIKTLKFLGLAGMMMLAFGCTTQTEEVPPEEPKKEETPVAQPEAPVQSSTSQYSVNRGDNLWNISGKSETYGNPYQWPLIYKANSDKIKDADLIYPGQVLDVDNNPSSGDVDAAVRHAKTRGSWSIGAVEESDKKYLGQ